MPEPLQWVYDLYVWREIFGDVLLVDGGLLDQPYHAMQDIQVAYLALRKREREQEISGSMFNDIGEPGEAVAAATCPGVMGGEDFLDYLAESE